MCCTSEEYHPALTDEENRPYNISDRPDLNSVMNSPVLKEVRQDMLCGKNNLLCTRCFETESMGGVSRRILENIQYEKYIPELLSSTEKDGALSGEIVFRSIDYRLGNLCNLKCTMCSPQSSSLWIKDWNEVKPDNEKLTEERAKLFSSYNWIEKEFLLEEFKIKIPFVDRLHFAGGEPLISPQMKKLLKACVEQGYAKNITLSYNTNVTKLPIEILELWKSFKEVKLLCSIDGFGKLNEYIRYPSKWEVIDRNLKHLDEKFSEYRITEILLSTTVQIYNILELPDLYQYLKQFKNIIPALNLINVHEPYYMQTMLLPIEAKQKAKEKLENVYRELENVLDKEYEYLRENIPQVIEFMNGKEMQKFLSVFRKVNSAMDKQKKLSLQEVSPELNKYIYDYYLERIVQKGL